MTRFATLSPSEENVSWSLAEKMSKARCHMAKDCEPTVGSLGGDGYLPVDTQGWGSQSLLQYELGNVNLNLENWSWNCTSKLKLIMITLHFKAQHLILCRDIKIQCLKQWTNHLLNGPSFSGSVVHCKFEFTQFKCNFCQH